MNKKILIADDDPGILDALTMMFELERFTVSSSLTGFTVHEIREHLPDLILLDIWMSGQDGRDICREIKKHEDIRKIPLILISASRDIRKSAMDSGADNFMEKPFDISRLMGMVKAYTTWST